MQDNPQRAFGLSGGDVANLALANLGAQNTFNQSVYGTRIAGQNQAILQNAQSTAALYGLAGSLGGAAIKGYATSPSYASPYLSASQYYPGISYGPESAAFTASAIGDTSGTGGGIPPY